MRDTLASESQIWAQRAIKSYLDGDYDRFFVEAGVSFELLGKAFLASYHPSLIVDRDFDSLLQVCGADVHSRRAPGNIRTIGAREVVNRVTQIVPRLKSYQKQLGLLADLRNGIVHMGSVGSVAVAEVMDHFVRATQIVLEALNLKFGTHFGEYSDVVKKLLDESSKEVEHNVVIKLAQASEAYKAKYGELDLETMRQVSDVIFKSYTFYAYEDEPVECPACSETGIASGDYELEWEQADWDDGTVEPIVTLYVNRFNCKMCGLTLEGREEIRVAGLPDAIEIENVDPADFYEPDHDPY